MMNFGSKNVRGGFFGTKRLVGFYLHGPDGEVLDSQTFDLLDDIDPSEPTEAPTTPPTLIGTVTVSGFATPNVGQQVTYSKSRKAFKSMGVLLEEIDGYTKYLHDQYSFSSNEMTMMEIKQQLKQKFFLFNIKSPTFELSLSTKSKF